MHFFKTHPGSDFPTAPFSHTSPRTTAITSIPYQGILVKLIIALKIIFYYIPAIVMVSPFKIIKFGELLTMRMSVSLLLSTLVVFSLYIQSSAQQVDPELVLDSTQAHFGELLSSPLAQSWERHSTFEEGGASLTERMGVFLIHFEMQSGIAASLDLSDADFDKIAAFTIREKLQKSRESIRETAVACSEFVSGRELGGGRQRLNGTGATRR